MKEYEKMKNIAWSQEQNVILEKENLLCKAMKDQFDLFLFVLFFIAAILIKNFIKIIIKIQS